MRSSSPAVFISSSPLIPLDPQQVEKAVQALQGPHFRSRDIVPAHWNLHGAIAQPFGYKQHLRVEPKPLQLLARKDLACHIAPKQLESALRIIEVEAYYQAHDDIEETSCILAEHRLMDADQRSVNGSRADGNLGSASLHGVDQFFQFFDRRGQIGVGEQRPIALRLKHSVPNGVAFAPVARILQHADARIPERELRRLRDCCVSRAIVYDQNFREIEGILMQIFDDPCEGRRQPLFFVISGNDD